MEESAKIGTCVEHSYNNKYFTEFVESQKKLKEKKPEALEDSMLEDDGLFLAWITRKYFKDNIWVSLLKILFGLVLLIIAAFIFKKGNSSTMNVLAIGMLMVGLFIAPAGLIFFFSNLHCYKHYKDYVTGRDDPFMDKVIKFYE